MTEPLTPELPVAVFDSGVGGLTVLHELLVGLPAEDYLYLGDTARFPYGNRSQAELQDFAGQIAAHLLGIGVKLLVIACNSATAAAIDDLRGWLERSGSGVEVIGVIEPESVLAAAATRNGRIGLLATSATVASGAYERAVSAADRHTQVVAVACPDLAPVIQAGSPFDDDVVAMVRSYCEPLRAADVDTVILGCTHYPLVRPLLQRSLGPNVEIITSGDAVARRVAHALSIAGLLKPDDHTEGSYTFSCTGDPAAFTKVGERFLQLPLGRVERTILESGDLT